MCCQILYVIESMVLPNPENETCVQTESGLDLSINIEPHMQRLLLVRHMVVK